MPPGTGGCRALVLDEADRMLELSLREQVQAVRSFLRPPCPSAPPDPASSHLQVRHCFCMGDAVCTCCVSHCCCWGWRAWPGL